MIKDTNKTLNELLLERMSTTYSKKPWYGRSFDELIGEVYLANLEIQRLLEHIIAWREYTIQVFRGGKPTIDLNSTADWPELDKTSNEIKERLEVTWRELEGVFTNFNSNNWHDLVWHGEYSYYHLASGIIDHDIYHLGQIVIHHKRANNN